MARTPCARGGGEARIAKSIENEGDSAQMRRGFEAKLAGEFHFECRASRRARSARAESHQVKLFEF
jgi:hypothetical protein